MALITAKSLEEWNTLQLDKWKSLEPNINTNTDSMVSMDAMVISEVAYGLEQDLITQTNSAFLAYANGDELSNLGIDRGIPRSEASKSTGIATFSRSAKTSVDYLITAGTLISSIEDTSGSVITFVTTEDGTLYGTVGVPVGLGNTTSTSGSVVDGTYTYSITTVDGNGAETSKSGDLAVVISDGLNNSSILLSWTPVVNAVSYNIYLGGFLLGNSLTPTYTDLVGTTASIVEPPLTNETGATDVGIAIESTATGVITNLGANSITKMIEPPVGIETVNNLTNTIGGADEETDAIYRARLVTELSNNFGKVTIAGYEKTAKAVEGVAGATVLHEASKPANEISAFITSTGDTPIPSAELITAVQTALNADDNRAVCDSIVVYAPTVVLISLTMSVTAYDSANYTEASLTTLITDTVQSFLLGLGTGVVVKVVDIANTIYSLDAVTDFVLTLPGANTTLATTEIASIGAVTITF